MELTLLHSFLKASKLGQWLTWADCPQIFQEIKVLFDWIYAPKTCDSNKNIMDDSKVHPQTCSVPSDPIVNAKGDQVSLQTRLWQNSIMYSVESTHAGNSQIYFYPNGDLHAPPVTGSIQYIYNAGNGPCLAVYCQRELPNHIFNPFSHYPHFLAKLHSSCLSTTLEQVDPVWIYCYYAWWVMDENHAAILKLAQVSVDSMTINCSLLNWPQE